MGANSGKDAAGSTAKAVILAAQRTALVAAAAVVPVTGNPKTEIGRNLPDTAGLMQGSTREFLPDRWAVAD